MVQARETKSARAAEIAKATDENKIFLHLAAAD